ATRRRSLRPLHSFPTRRSSDLARDVDVLATPATLGEAPDISDTGSNIFIRIWTLLHNPSLTLPIARGPRGLPVGLQLVGFQKEDARFLYWARCVENILGTRVNEVGVALMRLATRPRAGRLPGPTNGISI